MTGRLAFPEGTMLCTGKCPRMDPRLRRVPWPVPRRRSTPTRHRVCRCARIVGNAPRFSTARPMMPRRVWSALANMMRAESVSTSLPTARHGPKLPERRRRYRPARRVQKGRGAFWASNNSRLEPFYAGPNSIENLSSADFGFLSAVERWWWNPKRTHSSLGRSTFYPGPVRLFYLAICN